MAYTVEILEALKNADNGLLSKIQIGGKVYEIKDLIARENIETLSAGLDKIAGDLAAISYVEGTGVYATDAAIKKAIEDGDKSTKEYVDAQVGAINKFDVVVETAAGENGEPTIDASADTMYKLYLVPHNDAASGAYVEWITIRSGEEGAYTYKWESIGSTKMDVTGFVTSEALTTTLSNYYQKAEADTEMASRVAPVSNKLNKLIDEDLGTLAYKDSASGSVAGQTISGVKATGKSAGSITVELEATEKNTSAAGKFTPEGSVSGTVETAGSIAVTAKHEDAAATLSTGDYTPAGTVAVALSGGSFNTITSVGTAASFTEGEFTPASLTYDAVEKNVAKEGIVGSVEGETLTFTAAGLEAISASKVTAFNGGSKAADTFIANTPAAMAAHSVGVQSAEFTGTKAEDILVTGVSYKKADIDTATFTGATVDINAQFAGTEGDVSVAGKCKDYAVKTAQFNSADIELAVGDIAVSEKSVTVQ